MEEMKHSGPRGSVDPAVAQLAQRLERDTALDPYRSRERRRIAVILALVLILGVAAVAWAGSAIGTVLALAPAIGGVWFVRRLVRLRADLPDELVDERVRSVRNERYVEAYRILSALTVTVLIVTYIGTDAARIGWTLEARHVHALLWTFVLLSVALPSMLLAWQEREI
jgi:hypothetical protein